MCECKFADDSKHSYMHYAGCEFSKNKHMNTRERRENQTVVRHQGQIYKDKILCNNYSYTKTTTC